MNRWHIECLAASMHSLAQHAGGDKVVRGLSAAALIRGARIALRRENGPKPLTQTYVS